MSSTLHSPVLIVCALPQERAAIAALATGLEVAPLPGLALGALLRGSIDGTPVALLNCGVGKVAAAVAASAAMAIEPRCVISVGSAGALTHGFKVGDVVVAGEVLQHDFAAAEAGGFRLFGYGAETPSAGDPHIRTSAALIDAATAAALTAAQARNITLSRGRIATGDWFVNDATTRDAIAARTGADLVEMEGAAIAFTAARWGVPWLVIRSVSDAGDGAAAVSFWEYLELASANAAAIVRAILPVLPDR
ncbi:MAG: 5'-methylthioadenosine/S-adenosylhomocysteine nucleosidase [Chloroflexota bacterium]